MSFSCADVWDRFEAGEFKHRDQSLLYRLLRPKSYDPSKRYPLVVFFHGAGERGSDNRQQLIHGMADFAADDVREEYPCFVIAPQCPDGEQWVNVPWTSDRHDMPAQPSTAMRLTFALVDSLAKELSIDPNRLYVTGLSMGGFGVWDAIQREPKFFAAAVPICGGGDTSLADAIKHLPIWAFHGDGDTTVKTQRSRDMIAALKAAGGQPRYTEYPNTGHNSWQATYANREVYAWLFAQSRPESSPR
jgi:predicted peptidase